MKDLVGYQLVRSRIQSGDMLEWASGGFIGRAIRFFTKEDVNHTSLCTSLHNYCGSGPDRKWILQAEKNGIELALLSRELRGYKGSVWYHRLKPEYEHCRKAIESWAFEQVGIPYDYGNLFKNAFGAVSADMRKYFCSEYHFFALVAGGVFEGKYYFDEDNRCVRDKSGVKVLAPRPGEFGRYGIYEPRTKIY